VAIYYVKNGGSDALDGLSDGNAWATISKVNSTSLNAGDVVLFKCGSEWREILANNTYSGNSAAYIRYGSYSTGSKPIINGADVVTTWTNYSGNIWYANCPVLNTGTWGTNYDRVVVVDNVLYTQVGSLVEVVSANQYFINKSGSPHVCYLYSTTDPDTKTVQISARHYCIAIVNSIYIYIENIEVKYAGHSGIYLYTTTGAGEIDSYSIVNSCTAYGNRIAGVMCDNGYSMTNITNCTSTYNGNGYYSWGDSADHSSDDNIFSHCYAGYNIAYPNSGTCLMTDGHGFGIYKCHGVIVEYCETTNDNYGIIIDCGGELCDFVARYNYVHNTKSNTPGICIGNNAATGSVHYAYYNLVTRTGAGDTYGMLGHCITAGGSTGNRTVYIFNNTVYQDSTSNGAGITCYGGTNPGNYVYIKNNIIYSNNSVATLMYIQAGGTGSQIDYNQYYAPLDSTNLFGFVSSFYNDLASWRTATAQEANSNYGDPVFENRTGNLNTIWDFIIKSTSPCVNDGVSTGLTKDFFGNTISGNPDIGFNELSYSYGFDSKLIKC